MWVGVFRTREVIFTQAVKEKISQLKTTLVEQELKEQFPTASTSSLLQPGFVQELRVPHQKRAGTPGHQEAAGRDKRNLDKVMLHHRLVRGTQEQEVGVSPSTSPYKGEEGGTIESRGLANEQQVLLLPQPTNSE
ncbi:hypothetical protein llap_17737 [Limosa lapponica baueri]|uniref:Uncharacterized protein n=1 Tax=Limosa lapponica baueri TaxID=1758121 RepID=A0A2I0TDV9_LIMLA|nr:hypothetical protein llap_17737 [Limosa lapponica baueri]